MKHRCTHFAVLALLSIVGSFAPVLAAEPPRRLELAPCQEQSLPQDARCGTYEVFENRAARSGRKIPLRVVVLPAQGPDRLPDPVIYFAGGPGDSSVREGLYVAQDLAPLRARRDFLLVDLRGTGSSGGLFCSELQGQQGLQGFLDNFLPTDQIRACRDRMKKEVDLSWYTNDAAMDDVEEVRAALGYGKANLMGGSYGTRAVQTYLRRHPQSVRTITLLGVVTPDDRYPLRVARSAQEALDGLIAECEGDAACRGAFPQLRREMDDLLRRVTAEPVRVELFDIDTGQPFEVRLGRAGVAQTLRYLLYSPSGASLLPLLVHQAAAGDFEPLAQTARLYASFMTTTADGFYQSVTCAEDVRFISEAEIPAAVAGTMLGDFRIQKQRAACEGWPIRDLGKEIQAPVVSDVPALLISGERDPVTPAVNGEQVARTLKNGLHLIIADAAHSTQGMEGSDCVKGVMAAFIEAGTARGLDTACVARIRRQDFVLSPGDPEVTLPRADLERLAGTYTSAETGVTAEAAVVAGRLRITFDGTPALLIATSPTRFRIEGFSADRMVTFQMSGDRVSSMTLVEKSAPDLVLQRAGSSPKTGHLELAPCTEPGLPQDARCGTYEVFENRDARSGRKIPLRVVVLPAQGPDRLPDPVIYFAGGPGDSSVRDGLFLGQDLAALRPRRDFLLVDVRGTGGSGGLFCPELQGNQGVQGFLDNFLPTAKIHACRDRLKKDKDLSWYTTDAAMDDVEEVRAALGYGKANLMGGSYGTRAVLTYLRRHPQSVRTATLLGVVPPDGRYPLSVARDAQQALDGLVTECEGDAACRGAFPRLRQELDAVLRRVTAEPVRVELMDPADGRMFEVRLGRTGVAQALRYMTYSPSEAALLPLLVHEAAAGNFEPLAQTARLFASFMSTTSDGFYQSVTCAEDVAFIRDEEIPAATAGTMMGDFRVRQQKAACEGWPTRDLGKDMLEPVVSDVPALLISGERDPVTPAADGDRVVRTLKNGLHLIIADSGHSTSGMADNGCLDGVMAAFIEKGTAQGLDTACVAAMRRPDFVLSLGGPAVKLARTDLERLAGTYQNPETGLIAQVAVVADRLRVIIQEVPALLVAISPTRFRIEGFSPSQTVSFQASGDRITSMTLAQPGAPDLVMQRAAETSRRLDLTPCQEPGLPQDARCGTYEVFENRDARSGRKIPLRVVVLPARSPDRLPDPYIYFAGGPGDSSVEEGLYFAGQLAPIRAKRDVLLVDLRGTGGSDGMFCPEMKGRQGVQSFLDNFLPTEGIHACRDRLKKDRDLSWYTTGAAMDDVEEVRAALGYGKANLMGASYGTRAALTYLRRHPQSVRTVTLLGVVTPDDRYPLGLARSAQQALDGVIAECAGDAACHGAFPRLREEIEAVLRRVTAEPARVELVDPETGQPFELRLSRAGVAQTLRYLTYRPSGAALLPLLVHRAAAGDFRPLARTARLYGSSRSSTSDGFFQSATCAEDVAFIREEDIPAAVAGTMLGDFRIRKQKAACEGWPIRDLGKEILEPVVSDVPALLISGERDPSTPAEDGERVAQTLKNARHLIITDAAHSTDGMTGLDCLNGVIVAFIEAGTAQGLDTSCLAGIRRPDFVLSFGDPEVALKRTDLERLAGTYKNAASGMTAQADIVANRLRVTVDDEPALLVAISPTRFRVEGAVSDRKVSFQESGGRITSMTLTRAGEPDVVLGRVE